MIIGNHDIFGGVQTANDIFKFPSKCINTNYNEKIESFRNYFKELFENAFFPLNGNIFPFAKVIGEIVFIGINSIDKFSKLKNPFASNGHVSKNQKEGLQEILSKDEYKNKQKIVLTHHHFNKNNPSVQSAENSLWGRVENFTMKLRGKKKLLKLLTENGVSLVLHGHNHEIKEYSRKGIRFLNAGASVDNETDDEAGLFLIDIDRYQLKIGLDLLKKNSVDTTLEFSDSEFSPVLV